VEATTLPAPAGQKVFWFFFSKKNRLLSVREVDARFRGPMG
jgi:hypothetical protein